MATAIGSYGSPAAAPYQDEVPPPADLAPHEAIFLARQHVLALADQRSLNRGQSLALTTKLDRADEGLMDARPRRARLALDSFVLQVRGFVRARVLGPQDGVLLEDLATRASTGIEVILDVPVVLPGFQSCPTDDPCSHVVFHVRDDARKSGDGTAGAPFSSIGRALTAAGELGACGVEIVLGAGTYRETVTLDRPTRILGERSATTVIEGSVLDPGGHALEVSDVTFRDSPAPGAIVADGQCGPALELRNVRIRGATRHGVFQRHGSLHGLNVSVRGTEATPEERLAGTGVRLVGGVDAVLGFADLSHNDSGGLSAEGPDTRVYLPLSLVECNETNPHYPPPVSGGAGIEVGDGALLLSEFTSVEHNRLNGLRVTGGAAAHFRYGRLTRTGTLRTRDSSGSAEETPGVNAFSHDGAMLEMSGFRSTHSDIGLGLLEGYAVASRGRVEHNETGVAAARLPEDFVPVLDACLGRNGVIYDNDINLEISPPPPPCFDDCPEVCPFAVPFDCTWCTRSP